ncbi:hypothetical protein CAMRE0001_1238 [Campylobacter rectus RM3267]|uniref:Uncharacterized protein n=1 Tax=Campylobacter rectus RM3267 TaxID=553218 RepID=B9D0M9_CAMRE|nr:hypothetical protein CAMRE0001_1238 [Campylobacter rectus RM3267]
MRHIFSFILNLDRPNPHRKNSKFDSVKFRVLYFGLFA